MTILRKVDLKEVARAAERCLLNTKQKASRSKTVYVSWQASLKRD